MKFVISVAHEMELIATIILFVSFFGMLIIFARRIPDLKRLEVSEKMGPNFFSVSKQKVQKMVLAKSKELAEIGFWEVLLQKIVSKVRVFSLRIEAKCSRLLESTRERSKREKESKKYWERISKISLKKKK